MTTTLDNSLLHTLEACGSRVHGYVASCTRQAATEPDHQQADRLLVWAREGRRFLCTFDDVITNKLVMSPREVRRLADRLEWSVLTGAGS